ncbi:hypothetical protein DXG01_000877 [Tephrocybe rancida]|nr:hypothetical protein DXG01_000877 [Tephrocybe rancida]
MMYPLQWSQKAGLEESDQFCDLYGLDAEILSAIPRPVKAIIFVFPYTEARSRRTAEDNRIAREGGPKIDENVFWMKQTIHNACGAMAMMHSFANAEVTLKPGSVLEEFFERCRGNSITRRSQIFEEMPEFSDIHASVADAGQSVMPLTDDHPDQAYCAFVSAPGQGSTGFRVIELDGGRAGPVDYGECTDLLNDVARIVREQFMDKNPSVLYSMMYLGQPM